VIELHAQFLELNFLQQIRALPNPAFSPSNGLKQTPHPLTLHLSPTSTANIIVTSLTPALPASSPFAKLSPDAEVIVAPKERQRISNNSSRENRSVTSAGQRSAGGKSIASTIRRKSGRDDESNIAAIFLRGVDRGLIEDWFGDTAEDKNTGFKVWLDHDILLERAFRGAKYVSISVVKPASLLEPVDPQKEQDMEKLAVKIVASLVTWEDAPDSRHVAISTSLADALGIKSKIGGIIRVEPAPTQSQIPRVAKTQQSEGATKRRAIKIAPFFSTTKANASIKFGGDSNQEKANSAQKISNLLGSKGKGILNGPLTDGMLLPAFEGNASSWTGGILSLDADKPSTRGSNPGAPSWIMNNEETIPIEILPEVTRPSTTLRSWEPGEALPSTAPTLVGIDTVIEQLTSHLSHLSSVLLIGGLGAGKTNLAYVIAHRLRSDHLIQTLYFPCRSLITDETRVSAVKDTLTRLFASASWGARLGGRSIIILDDLDRLCPAETELQVNENARSRQASEILCSLVHQYCSYDSGVALLATAQSKEVLNNIIIGSHVIREIVSLKAPNKDGRCKIIEKLLKDDTSYEGNSLSADEQRLSHSDSANFAGPVSSDTALGFVVEPYLDFLELAGQTDGYMPGDLVLLVSRARSEALIRTITSTEDDSTSVSLGREDFARAQKGFTPASLRNVTLQSSTTRWDSIGGLHSTRRILLETLQYPTTYAPIFAQCPLRLRSGLLLYGYPGCGKTLLASAVAGECGLNFISVKGPEILNKYIGASEKAVRDLFERAEAARPCVLFFDEFDSIAPKRGHDSTGVTDRVVNQLLTQMDGAEGLSGVYVLAATSRPDLIDPALLRPGRLDKSIICDMPDLDERVDILRAVTRKLRLAQSLLTTGDEGENLREIALRCEGYSGADLQAVVYNAQLEAIHDVLGDQDLSSAALKSKKRANGTTTSTDHKIGIPDFSYFRIADELSSDTLQTSSTALTERAVIAANISSLQTLRRKQKQLQHQQSHSSSQLENEQHHNDEPEQREPTIQWRHIRAALATTRSSISARERNRLAAIYREFVEGRSGEMPNGEAGRDVGGRTSLM
jgi:peroxin-1